MAEFLTKEQADHDYGSKGKTNAGLTLGIIGTALGAGLLGNNGNDGCCCGGGNNGGILGNILGGNRNGNGCCCAARQAENRADAAMTMAMAQGQIANNLAWSNRVQSMHDDMDLYVNMANRDAALNTSDWINRTKSMQDDFDVHTRSVNRDISLGNKIANESQLLTNQIWKGRVEDLQEKFDIYARGVERDTQLRDQINENRVTDLKEKFDTYTILDDKNSATNRRICEYALNDKDEKFQLYKMSNDADYALDNKFTKINYEGRIQDLNEKFDLYTRLNNKITDLEKAQAKTETALPLMFELNKVNSERYTDACCCSSEKNLLMTANGLQRQLDHKINGELKYAYSDLCAPVPSISPLYCAPFTRNGMVPTQNTNCCGINQ